MRPMEVIYEDNHLLVIVKPPGLTTQGAVDEPSVYTLAKDYLKEKYQKPGNVYLGIVSRIDKRVGGVLVLARTSKAASRLSQQFRDGHPKKTYLAVVEGQLPCTADPETLVEHVLKSEQAKKMRIVDAIVPGAQLAKLRWRCLATHQDKSLCEIELLTGRKHQIRVQLAGMGHPIVGDQKYGSHRPFNDAIALHAYRLQIEHPTRKEPMEFKSAPPATWSRFGFDSVIKNR